MNALENRLRQELRAESELISPGSLSPLNLRQHTAIGPVRDGRRRQRLAWLAPVAAAASVAVIAALVAVVPHQARPGREPGVAALPTAGEVRGVYALSASDAWAVGDLQVGQTRWSNLTSQALALHWNGSSWQRVKVPGVPGDSELHSIAGTSADNIWAVGVWGNGFHPIEPFIVHWNGRSWSRARFAYATKAGVLNGVAAASATDAWAVGQTGGQKPGALILHWNGSTWTQVPAADPATSLNLLGVTAISAGDAWAVGNSVQGLQIDHWNGSSWTRPRSAGLLTGPNVVFGVAADPAGTVWAVGFTEAAHAAPIILRWTGGAWHRIRAPAGGASDMLSAVTAISPDDVWAAGGGFGQASTKILHWDGTSWSQRASLGDTFRGGIEGLAAVSADNVWAVGYRGASETAGVPQILHWNGTKWTRVYGPASTRGLLENSSCGPYQTCRHH